MGGHMNDPVLNELHRFAARGAAAQSAVDHAIARAELVRKLHSARRTERALRDELTDARMRVGFAVLALDQFDEGRAPA